MENVFDIKRKKNLNIVLPKDFSIGKVDLQKYRCAVLVHLYYEDTVDKYIQYIKNIPQDINVFFTYTDGHMRDKLEQKVAPYIANLFFIKKENRGRDISALLVATREKLLDYDYICFVHDKKEKKESLKKDAEEWIYSLWENTLGSQQYIENILYTLTAREDIGLLVPPHMISDGLAHGYMNKWGKNYEIAVGLAEAWGLNCNLDKKKNPITFGTVFWAKTKALRRLLERKWEYKDFDDEPLADDETISHAIERMFAYIVQDAGYDTGWSMTDRYASEYIEIMQDALTRAFDALDENLGIRYIGEIGFYRKEREKLVKFAENKKKIYIYGAGLYGTICFKILRSADIKPEGFIVTDKSNEAESVHGLPVWEVRELVFSAQDGIIIAAKPQYAAQMQQSLENQNIFSGMENVAIFCRWEAIE